MCNTQKVQTHVCISATTCITVDGAGLLQRQKNGKNNIKMN